MRKSFANRLILNFTLVVFVGFLAVYFLFNSLIDNHIRTEAEAELNREIMTLNQNTVEYLPVFEFDGHSSILVRNNRLQSARAIVNVDTIIIDESMQIIHPVPNNLSESEMIKVEALATFWSQNQEHFEASDNMIMTTHDGHTFYMRATSHYILHHHIFSLEATPVTVLMYTDITPAMNLKNSMNQVLLALLATAGTLTLSISIILSTRFKKTIIRLSSYAKTIGQGNFDEKINNLNYNEFEELGSSMNTMANMLDTYETNQKQFFQNASHELRTPLMSIQGYAEALQSGVFDTTTASYVILEESQKMTALINDILYLSKLNTEKNEQMVLQTITADDLIQGCARRVKILAQKEEKILITNPTPEVSFETDKDKLERAIINILANAIRYAQSEIRIDCMLTHDSFKISITNDGTQISNSDLPHIFERFYKGRSGNTGLGLAITNDIVTMLGGVIYCKNLDIGVEFVISLPL